MPVSTSELTTLKGNLVAEGSDCIYVEEKSSPFLTHRIGKMGRMLEISRFETGDKIEVTVVVPMLDVMMGGMGRLVI